MTDGELVLDYFVVGLMWALTTLALLMALALILTFRQERPKAPAVPDFVPPEWDQPPTENAQHTQ
jgi:hypothetical protein